ncbi:type 1 fimbrial protein [Buttiauxella sp. WJP83]|uniref:fimbrial protein n=1 Tax=Buttiauxella sp. WJP83 TaxID=2986951 RepID=UPI0022DDBB93|nr:fimbrial protein [Buttiauxella sp. WJP83]WBM72471.1 type 1 fimbrial protein [Buttiauxella sp. WJP83]
MAEEVEVIKYNLLLRAAVIFAFMGGEVMAADIVNINITGRVLAAPCVVDAGSVSQNVDFGQLIATDLRAAGSSSEWKPFKVTLVNCPVSTVAAIATFTGTPFATDATLYSNATSPTDASNVAIQVVDDSNRSIVKGNGTSMTTSINPASHQAVFALAGRVISPNGNAGSGRINSVVMMTFTYQ